MTDKTRHRFYSVPGLFSVSVIVSEIHCNQYSVHDSLGCLKLPVRQALHALRQHVYDCQPLIIITGAK